MDFKRAIHGKIAFLGLKNRAMTSLAVFHPIYASLIT